MKKSIKDVLRCVLAWRDFAKAMKEQELKDIEEETLKWIDNVYKEREIPPKSLTPKDIK